MSNPSPATYSAKPGTAGFWNISDPAGVTVLSTTNPGAAITAAHRLTSGMAMADVRALMDAEADGAPAPVAPVGDGYDAESMAGFVGTAEQAAAITEAALAAAPQADAGLPVTMAPLVTEQDMADPLAPITVPFPALGEGKAYRFINPAAVPALDAWQIAELAMAAQSESLQQQLAAFVQIVPRFLRKFMHPDDIRRFEGDARVLIGADGIMVLSKWLAEDITPRYAGFPTPPAGS